MKRYFMLLAACGLLLVVALQTPGRAMIVGRGCTTCTGKLKTIHKNKKHYQLKVGTQLVFIPADDSPQNRKLLKNARQLTGQQVTVIFIEVKRQVVSIFPAKPRTGH